jgi:hypothetical protein
MKLKVGDCFISRGTSPSYLLYYGKIKAISNDYYFSENEHTDPFTKDSPICKNAKIISEEEYIQLIMEQ